MAAGHPQGSFDEAHLVSYLDEFVFRSSRRRSRSRGMLFYRLLESGVAHEPVPYEDIVASQRPRRTPLVAPEQRGHPASLERPAASRPWSATG